MTNPEADREPSFRVNRSREEALTAFSKPWVPPMPSDPKFIALVERNVAEAHSEARALVAEFGAPVAPRRQKRENAISTPVKPRSKQAPIKPDSDFTPTHASDKGRKMTNEFVDECYNAYLTGLSMREVIEPRFHRLKCKTVKSALVILSVEFKRRGYPTRKQGEKPKLTLAPVPTPVQELPTPRSPADYCSFDAAEYAAFLSRHYMLDTPVQRG